jgi:hypothetical protein
MSIEDYFYDGLDDDWVSSDEDHFEEFDGDEEIEPLEDADNWHE